MKRILTSLLHRLGLAIAVVFLFSMCISIVSASVNWHNWGNAGYNGGGSDVDGVLFGSNYPQGNINFTEKSLSVSSTFAPLVADTDFDGVNEVFFFSGSFVRMFDNGGVLLDLYNMGTSIFANPIIMNYDNDVYLDVLVITSNSSHYIYNLLRKDGNVITEVKSGEFAAKIDWTFNPNVCGGIEYSQKILNSFTMFNFSTVPITYSIDEDILDVGPIMANGPGYRQTVSLSGYAAVTTDLGWAAADWDLDGTAECLMAAVRTGGNDCVYGIFDPVTQLWDLDDKYVTDCAATGVVAMTWADLGQQGDTKDIIYCQSGVGTDFIGCHICTPENGVCFNTSQPIMWGENGADVLFPVVSDINNDGTNDICTAHDSKLDCFEQDFTRLVHHNVTDTSMSFMAFGEYDSAILNNGENWQELITWEGMYSFNGINWTQIYSFGTDWASKDAMFMPVSINNQASFTKDLLGVGLTSAIYYTASGSVSICGDGLCTSGETSFSCFVDCIGNVSLGTNDSLGSFGAGQECSQDSDCFGDMSCSGNLCSGFSSGTSCTQDFECASGDCTSFGFCSKQDFVDIVQGGATQLGFTSTASKLFLSLLLILLGAGIGAGIFSAGGAVGAVAGGIIGLFLGSIMAVVVFTWLGAAVVFMILFLTIVIVTLIIMFKGG